MQRDIIRTSCFDKALYALATSRVYSWRASSKENWLKFNTCLGILIPSLVGGIVLTYGKEAQNLDLIIWVVGLLGLAQLVISIISVVCAWEESKNYYIESSISNRNLFESFEHLAKFPPTSDDEFKDEFDKMVLREAWRNDLDDKYPFDEKEERKGMRYSLRYFRRACATCNIIPPNMKTSDCDTCGNF